MIGKLYWWHKREANKTTKQNAKENKNRDKPHTHSIQHTAHLHRSRNTKARASVPSHLFLCRRCAQQDGALSLAGGARLTMGLHALHACVTIASAAPEHLASLGRSFSAPFAPHTVLIGLERCQPVVAGAVEAVLGASGVLGRTKCQPLWERNHP